METNESLVRALVDEVPALRPTLEEHLDDNFGTLLPYLFLADVARWIDAHHDEDEVSSTRIVDFLERQYRDAHHQGTKDLIGAGFLESVDVDSYLFNMLGPILKSAF